MMKAILLVLIFTAAQLSPASQLTAAIDLCKLIATPSEYNGKVLTIEGILYPSDHSIVLYRSTCAPKEGSDVSMQAVLPENWNTLPNSRRLSSYLKKRIPARVKVTGLFESAGGRYGPDAARFRFTINAISSVDAVPKDQH